MSSNVLTLVTVFLPLSSLWASASLSHRSQASAPDGIREGNRQKHHGSTTVGSSGPLVDHQILSSPPSPSTTAVTRTSQLTIPSPGSGGEAEFYRDLEAQGVGYANQMEKS